MERDVLKQLHGIPGRDSPQTSKSFMPPKRGIDSTDPRKGAPITVPSNPAPSNSRPMTNPFSRISHNLHNSSSQSLPLNKRGVIGVADQAKRNAQMHPNKKPRFSAPSEVDSPPPSASSTHTNASSHDELDVIAFRSTRLPDSVTKPATNPRMKIRDFEQKSSPDNQWNTAYGEYGGDAISEDEDIGTLVTRMPQENGNGNVKTLAQKFERLSKEETSSQTPQSGTQGRPRKAAAMKRKGESSTPAAQNDRQQSADRDHPTTSRYFQDKPMKPESLRSEDRIAGSSQFQSKRDEKRDAEIPVAEYLAFDDDVRHLVEFNADPGTLKWTAHLVHVDGDSEGHHRTLAIPLHSIVSWEMSDPSQTHDHYIVKVSGTAKSITVGNSVANINRATIFICFSRTSASWKPEKYASFWQDMKKTLHRSKFTVYTSVNSRTVHGEFVNEKDFTLPLQQSRESSPAEEKMSLSRAKRLLADTTPSSSRAISPPRQRRLRPRAKAPSEPESDPDEIILVYPPTGTGALNITNGLMRRLAPGEFLNDTLIEFGLKLWLNDVKEKSPQLAEEIHVFNSFFYKKLDVKQTQAEASYKSVRKWTSKFDLFKKKFLIVPINENVHWYLAIICFPERVLLPPLETVRPAGSTTRSRKSLPSKEASPPEPPDEPAQLGYLEEEELQYPDPMEVDEAPRETSKELSLPFESMRIDAPEEEPLMVIDGPTSEPPNEPPSQPEPVPLIPEYQSRPPSPDGVPILEDDEIAVSVPEITSQEVPYVFTMDSLGGGHPKAGKILARYLCNEAKDKKGYEVCRTSVYKKVEVPYQPNYCDCGIYLLHFVKTFMDNPDEFIESITRSKKKKQEEIERQWQGEVVPNFRGELRDRIEGLSREWKATQAPSKAASLPPPSLQRTSESQAPSEPGEPEGLGQSITREDLSEGEVDELLVDDSALMPKAQKEASFCIEDSEDDDLVISGHTKPVDRANPQPTKPKTYGNSKRRRG